jgi:hypothetical protein
VYAVNRARSRGRRKWELMHRRTTLEKQLASDPHMSDTLRNRQRLALGRRESKYVPFASRRLPCLVGKE